MKITLNVNNNLLKFLTIDLVENFSNSYKQLKWTANYLAFGSPIFVDIDIGETKEKNYHPQTIVRKHQKIKNKNEKTQKTEVV